MNKTLLTCLLAAAVFFRAQGSGNYPGRAIGTGRCESHLAEATTPLPDAKAPGTQDTSKLGSQRLRSDARLAIASTYARASQRIAETLTPEQPDSTRVALSETADFDPETANLPAALAITLRRPAAPLGRRNYRTRLVRTSRWATRPEAVEILTCTYAGPLVLALLPATEATPAQLLAGPGYDQATPLRPLELTPEAVLRLCGDRAPQVQAYARLYNLHFQQAAEVARMLDYYNRIAVVKE